jgi:hypothetical protein
MKDYEAQSIFKAYSLNKSRLEKINFLREGFGDGGNPFTGNDSSEDKSDDSDKSDSSEDKSDDKGSSSSSSPSPKPKSSSSPSKSDKKDGKLSEEELDEELDYLTTKKEKIQKLFDSESIDKEVATAALEKIKLLTNQLVEKYI